MRSRLSPRLLCAFLIAGPGCALLGPRPDDPAVLLADARVALAASDFDLAYDRLSRIRALHPDSAEAGEAYPLAAAVFKRAWYRDRYQNPGSRFHSSEPVFMYEWLGSYFDGEFPQPQAEQLFLGMPHDFFDRFQEWARGRAAIEAWKISAPEDNGRIEAVSAERASQPPTPGS